MMARWIRLVLLYAALVAGYAGATGQLLYVASILMFFAACGLAMLAIRVVVEGARRHFDHDVFGEPELHVVRPSLPAPRRPGLARPDERRRGAVR